MSNWGGRVIGISEGPEWSLIFLWGLSYFTSTWSESSSRSETRAGRSKAGGTRSAESRTGTKAGAGRFLCRWPFSLRCGRSAETRTKVEFWGSLERSKIRYETEKGRVHLFIGIISDEGWFGSFLLFIILIIFNWFEFWLLMSGSLRFTTSGSLELKVQRSDGKDQRSTNTLG